MHVSYIPLYIRPFWYLSQVNGILENNGHSIVFRIEEVQQQQSSSDTESSSPENEAATSPTRNPSHITITGGPLSYTYVFDSIYLHFGRADSLGSEHFMDGISFPAEVWYKCLYINHSLETPLSKPTLLEEHYALFTQRSSISKFETIEPLPRQRLCSFKAPIQEQSSTEGLE